MIKKILILSFALLGLVFGLVMLFQARSSHDLFINKRANFTENNITEFQINNFTQSLRFFKKNEDWYFKPVLNKLGKRVQKETGTNLLFAGNAEQKADVFKVTELLTYSVQMPEISLVSKDPSKLSLFEINEYSLHVIFYGVDNKELGRIYIGKHGPVKDSSFVAFDAHGFVYMIKVNLKKLALMAENYWLDLSND